MLLLNVKDVLVTRFNTDDDGSCFSTDAGSGKGGNSTGGPSTNTALSTVVDAATSVITVSSPSNKGLVPGVV